MAENIQNKILGMTPAFLIQLAVLIVGLTVSYVTMDLRSQGTARELDLLKSSLVKVDTKVREVETSQIRLDERFTNIMTSLTRIEGRLERYDVKP